MENGWVKVFRNARVQKAILILMMYWRPDLVEGDIKGRTWRGQGMSCVDIEETAFCRRELPLQASSGRRALSEFQALSSWCGWSRVRDEPLIGVEDREVVGHRDYQSLVIIKRTSSNSGNLRSHGSIFSGIMMGLDLYF